MKLKRKLIHIRVKRLLENIASSDSPIKAARLAKMLEIQDGAGQPKTRKLIKEVITIYKIPIVASSKGFWVAENKDQVKTYLESLKFRALRTRNRMRLIEIASIKYFEKRKRWI